MALSEINSINSSGFPSYRVFFPGILLFISLNDHGDVFQRRLLKLRLDGFGDLFGRVGVDIVDAFLDGVGKAVLWSDGDSRLSWLIFPENTNSKSQILNAY